VVVMLMRKASARMIARAGMRRSGTPFLRNLRVGGVFMLIGTIFSDTTVRGEEFIQVAVASSFVFRCWIILPELTLSFILR